jgi:hypothetical protein
MLELKLGSLHQNCWALKKSQDASKLISISQLVMILIATLQSVKQSLWTKVLSEHPTFKSFLLNSSPLFVSKRLHSVLQQMPMHGISNIFARKVKEDSLSDHRALVIDPVGNLLHVHNVLGKECIPLSSLLTMKQYPLSTCDRAHSSILVVNEEYTPQ